MLLFLWVIKMKKDKSSNKIKIFLKKNITLIKSLVTITLFFFNSIFEFIPAIIFDIDYNKISSKMRIMLSFYDYFILACILFFMYRKDIARYFKDLKKRFPTIIDKGFLYWTTGLIIMVISNLLIIKFIPLAKAGNEAGVQQVIKTLPFLSFISVGILGPIIEEFTFRKAFYDIFKNKDAFIVVSGIVFGLMHVIFSFHSGWDLFYVIPYASLGICFAIMYVKTDNLFTPMAMHIIHNSLLTLASIISLSL